MVLQHLVDLSDLLVLYHHRLLLVLPDLGILLDLLALQHLRYLVDLLDLHYLVDLYHQRYLFLLHHHHPLQPLWVLEILVLLLNYLLDQPNSQ